MLQNAFRQCRRLRAGHCAPRQPVQATDRFADATPDLVEAILTEALPDGASTGAALSGQDLARMIRSYYRARGWTDEGAVPQAALEALDLADVTTPAGASTA